MNDDTAEWPCHCGGEHPEWEYHADNACGDHLHYMDWCSGGRLGDRYPDLGGEHQ